MIDHDVDMYIAALGASVVVLEDEVLRSRWSKVTASARSLLASARSSARSSVKGLRSATNRALEPANSKSEVLFRRRP